jgi:GTP-binding protein HflX
VLNKIDLLDEQARHELRLRHPQGIALSAHTGEGLSDLTERIDHDFQRTLCPIELLVPYSHGDSLAEIHELAGNVNREDTPEGVRVRALIPSRLAERYARFAVAS